MADTNKQEMSDMDKNIAAQEELAGTDINLIDASDKLKENKNPIDPDTATNSPTKGMLDIADEIVSEADYTPSSKQSEKIAKKAKKKALKQFQEQLGLSDEQADEVPNYQSTKPETYDLVEAAKARLARSEAYDKNKGDMNSQEYKEAAEAAKEAFAKIGIDNPSKMSEDMAKDIIAKADYYDTFDKDIDEYMSNLRNAYEAQLNKVIDDDTKSWAERKKLMDKTGLLFSHVMQNIGAMMHNAVNPTDWITASDPITLRAAQNLTNTIKNRQTNNDTYIDSQIELWKNVLPAYYDVAKIKQNLSNTRIRNEYKRLNEAGQKMIMALAASDAWDTVSDNAILSFMDNLQDGKYQTTEQMVTGLLFAAVASSSENRSKIVDKFIRFAKDLGLDTLAKNIKNYFDNDTDKETPPLTDSNGNAKDFSGLKTHNVGTGK